MDALPTARESCQRVGIYGKPDSIIQLRPEPTRTAPEAVIVDAMISYPLAVSVLVVFAVYIAYLTSF